MYKYMLLILLLLLLLLPALVLWAIPKTRRATGSGVTAWKTVPFGCALSRRNLGEGRIEYVALRTRRKTRFPPHAAFAVRRQAYCRL